jgi:hypothetical protein
VNDKCPEVTVILLEHIRDQVRQLLYAGCNHLCTEERLGRILKYAAQRSRRLRPTYNYHKKENMPVPEFVQLIVPVDAGTWSDLLIRAPNMYRAARYNGMLIEMTWQEVFLKKKKNNAQAIFGEIFSEH